MKNSKTLLGIGLLGLTVLSVGVILIKSDAAIAVDGFDKKVAPRIVDPSDGNSQNLRSNTLNNNRVDELDNSRINSDSYYVNSEFNYDGIENKQETVYNIDFSGESVMEITGGDANILRMFQLPVLINLNRNSNDSNSIANGTISNVLGGENMKISGSNNITIIGGTNSEIQDNNHAATLFGGKNNKLFSNLVDNIYDVIPSVLLGGTGNHLKNNHNANVIVGGMNNRIDENSTNITILGGDSTAVSGENLIVGGGNIQGNISNAFVFNDGQGQLDVSESLDGVFYLNVENGVRLGKTRQTVKKGVFSQGSVNLGNVKVGGCTGGKVGMMGTFQGCILGCTAKSALEGKWELLDNGKDCENICKSNSGICRMLEKSETTEDYHSFCTSGVNTQNAYKCSVSTDTYNNVIFQTYLLDSDKNCPNNAINQCIFRCNTGTHLVKDESGKKGGETRCFSDCTFAGESYGHNSIIDVYSQNEASCGDNIRCEAYKSQLMCVDGVWYSGDAQDTNVNNLYKQCNDVCMSPCQYSGQQINHGSGIQVYTLQTVDCPNECNSVNLQCYDGTFYSGLVLSGQDFRSGTPISSYVIFDSCTTNSNSCDGYNVTAEEYNLWKDGSGSYSSCIPYTVNENSCQPESIKYKLDSCSAGSHTEDNKSCTGNVATVPCDATRIPEHAIITSTADVTITWNDSFGWSNTRACEWECDDGYTRFDNDECVQNGQS